MADIFLSYSSKDKDRVRPLVLALEREGWSVWWDRKTPAGETFDEMIERELSLSKCVVVVWSSDSVQSRWVREEAEEGRVKNCLFPAIIDDVKIPLGFRLIQAVNLAGWSGDIENTEYQHLIQSIKDKIGDPAHIKKASSQPAEKKPSEQSHAKTTVSQEGRILLPTPVTRRVQLPDGKEIQFEMVDLPGGDFVMGGSSSYEKPIHKVQIAPFAIGKYQVTQAEWKAVMGGNPSQFNGDRRPVENVSWKDVQEFLTKIGNGYRLPTEAEWEYACRGGTTTEYSFGDDESQLGEYAWYYNNAGSTTHPVGEKKPNQFGLYDMHGNVWEWCQDHWHNNYKGAPDDGSAWVKDGKAALRVIRGGGWFNNAVSCRSANRNGHEPGARPDYLGFRLSRTLP